MFWRKQTYQDEELGELQFNQNSWSGRITSQELHEILVNLEGSKERPESASLNQSKYLIKNIANNLCEARSYLKTQNIQNFTTNSGDIVFEGLSSYSEIGKFDLHFGLSEWDDAFIIVHFQNNIPINISLGD
jgi:hypothetical protein